VQPGRATRGGSSYVGIGANIGLGDDSTALGDTNVTVISKIGLANFVSVRPSVVIGDNTTVLIPLTYDLNLRPTGVDTEAVSLFAPYVGAGVAISTGDDSDVGPMLTAGVDVPVSPQFTANVGVNVGFFDDTDVGIQIGVGYNFAGF
jgi:acetyltransferase-like isoleucine patch superfamily enzyme